MKKVFSIILNKYVITAAAFGAWMFFFDQNDVVQMEARKKELQKTKDHIAYLNGEIAKMEKEKSAMASSPQMIEQYAREHYLMKRTNEDVYVIEK